MSTAAATKMEKIAALWSFLPSSSQVVIPKTNPPIPRTKGSLSKTAVLDEKR
jgi:hypothetical protein